MLRTPRITTKPFEYPFAYDYWLKQQQSIWLHTNINLSRDVLDYNTRLSADERTVVRTILQLFTEIETIVGEYWSTKVTSFFPKPEIAMMAASFANMESIHAIAYSALNDTLGLSVEESNKFLEDKVMSYKLDKLRSYLDLSGDSNREIALSLAVFSAFTEGVCLFSSFAVLKNFSRYGKMHGIFDLITYSMRDETLHSDAGCRLFREFLKENPDLWDDSLKANIYEAARVVADLEESFMDRVFRDVPSKEITGIKLADIKKYIRHRTNTKLADLNLSPVFENTENHNFEWVDLSDGGAGHADFFSRKVTEYSKGTIDVNPDDIF